MVADDTMGGTTSAVFNPFSN